MCDQVLLIASLGDCDWNTVKKELSALSVKSRPTEGDDRYNVPQSLLELVADVFERILSKVDISDNCQIDILHQCTAECFRIFRNCCAGKPENQNFIANQTQVLNNTSAALNSFLQISNISNNLELCIQTSVQFLGNLVVNNKPNQKLVWDKYSHIIEDLLTKRRNPNSTTVANYSAMILHNIVLGFPEVVPELSLELHRSLIDLAMQDAEFALCAVQLLLENEDYINNIYQKVESGHRLFLLDTAHSLILSQPGSMTILPVSSVVFITHHFKSQSDSILKTVGQYIDELEPAETAKLLEVVASASGNIPYLEELQTDLSLLIDCSYLLQTIHTVGKASDNNFTSIQRLADLTSTGGNTDVLQSHPAFNFKCGLIRLLGNLCWRHRVNQDKVRELDCIPLLLDCCNMDARNPLIIQWVVMAVRNFCEGNLENQAVVAAMNRRGTVSSATLQEMGLTLSDDGESKICIARLEQ